MDRDGVVYHAWPIDPAVQWGETLSGFAQPENITPIGAHVYDNGDLLATFQGRNTFPFGVGVAKFDREGKLLWKKENNAHHWFDIDDQGLIYTVAHRLRDSPIELGDTDRYLNCEDGQIYEDFVVVLDSDGNVVEEFSLLDAYVKSGYAGLLGAPGASAIHSTSMTSAFSRRRMPTPIRASPLATYWSRRTRSTP